MIGFLSSLFGSGIVGSIERIASEAIETDKESAEAKALFVKTLDPNGNMRRQLSQFSCVAYGFYLVATVVLIFMSVWGVGGETCVGTDCVANADVAAGRMTELFLPITGSWAAIVSASFGVNGVNSYKGNA